MYTKRTRIGKILDRLYGTPKQDKEQDFSIEEFIYRSYIKAWQMMREKRNMLSDSLEQDRVCGSDELWYDIPCYLEIICERIQKLMGGITKTDYRNISVIVLYKLNSAEGNEWKGVQASEEFCKMDAQEFIKSQGALFCKLLKEDLLYYYEDSDSREQDEEASVENRSMEQKGASFGIRADFEGGGQRYVNGILFISVCGNGLSEVARYCRSVGKTFENVLIYSVLPYFIQLIQTELGMLYLWEQREKCTTPLQNCEKKINSLDKFKKSNYSISQDNGDEKEE